MLKFKKHSLIILIAMLMLIAVPISFAADNATDARTDDILQAVNGEALSLPHDGINVEDDDIVIDEGDNATIEGLIYFNDGENIWYDQLNVKYSYIDAEGINKSGIVDYVVDYSSEGFKFTLTDLKSSGSPYIITLDVVHDEYYDEYLWYGDEIQPAYVKVTVIPNVDPEPAIPAYETFTPVGQIYVDCKEGNDTAGNGSESSPFATIQRALDENKALNGSYEIIVNSGEYYFEAYYTIYDNVRITGRGNVKIVNLGSTYILFLSKETIKEFINLTFTGGLNAAISGSSTINGLGEDLNEGKILNIINCTFMDNSGYVGAVITYSKTTILQSTFIHNDAYGNTNEWRGIINSRSQPLTVNFCNFIDNNVVKGHPLIEANVRSDANFNFWGSNDGPKDGDVLVNSNLMTWIGVTGEVNSDDVVAASEFEVVLHAKYTNGSGIYNDLNITMPDFNVTLSPSIGSVSPQEVTISENRGNTTYISQIKDLEKISIMHENVKLSEISFRVNAPLLDRIYVSSNSTASGIGTEANPFKTIKDAVARNKELGGGKTIIIMPGNYSEHDLEIADNVTLIGTQKDGIIIDGENNVILNISADVIMYNLTFTNAQEICHNSGNLVVYDSTFNNKWGIISFADNLSIYGSTFNENIKAICAVGKTVIDNCNFKAGFSSMLSLEGFSTISNSNFENVLISSVNDAIIVNNTFNSFLSSIAVAGIAQTVIENNTISSIDEYAVYCMNMDSVILSNNNITSGGIYLELTNATVFNNNIDNGTVYLKSANASLQNNSISNNIPAIILNESLISNAVVTFLENSTVKVKNGTVQLNATVTDDMSNAISGGNVIFTSDGEIIGNSSVINGTAAFSRYYDDGNYVISGSFLQANKTDVKTGLLRVNVKTYWYINETGFETLIEAVAAAGINDIIKGVPGFYKQEQVQIGHRTRPSEPYTINKNITITSLTDEPVILSGIEGNIFNIDYYSNVTFINLVLRDAYNPEAWGGAIHSMGKNTIVVDNCTFIDNYAEDGAGIHAWGNLYITNSRFIDNEARVYGGALFKDGDGNLIVENVTFINNTAYTYAGAVYTMGYSEINQTFKNVLFDGNEATCGGAMFTAGKNVTFTDCNFTNNRAIEKGSGYEPLGGAFYAHHGASRFVNVNFINNYAEGSGGALELDNGVISTVGTEGRVITINWAILENCLIENNTATTFGGAISTRDYASRTHVNITDSTIRNNNAGIAALFVNLYGFYNIDNVLFEDNINTEGGSLVYTYGVFSIPESYYANTTITNSQFKNNAAESVIDTSTVYSTVNITDCLFDGEGTIVVSNESTVFLTNIIESNPAGNISVDNRGNLSLENNTFVNPIVSTGEIHTPCVLIVIGNETRYLDVGETEIDAAIFDDNNNSIIGSKVVFFINSQLIASTLDGVTYKANYTVIPKNQTIYAVYQDLGIENITTRYGIIIGRVMPQIAAEDIEFNITGEFRVSLTDNGTPLSGEKIILTVDGRDYELTTGSDGMASQVLELALGKYVAEFRFDGNEFYIPASNKSGITVHKYVSNVKVHVNDISVHETAVVNITLDKNATGDIFVDVDGEYYFTKAENGNAIVEIPDLNLGQHEVFVEYYGDRKYLSSSDSCTFRVSLINVTMDVESNSTTVDVQLPGDATGSVTVSVDGNEIADVGLVDGVASVLLEDLTPGSHNVEVRYSGDGKYSPDIFSYVVNVPDVTVPDDNSTNQDDNSTVPDGNSTDNNSTVPDGNSTLPDGNSTLPDGNSTVPDGNSTDNPETPTLIPRINTVIVVDSKFSRLANDYNAGERGAFFYAVLLDEKGNPLVNKTVQIAVNGPIYNVTTDSEGRAGLQVNLAVAAIYTYALSYQGDDVYKASPLASSKLTVTKKKTSISASSIAFKKSKKTKSISVTLKTVKNPYDGKIYLKKGKKLTLKVNGKTYSAQTNSKGVAKFTVVLTKKGKYSATIKFAGDNTYKGSSKKINIRIK